jgi:predicted phage-related endonuclease
MTDPERAAWLAERRTAVCSTDTPALFGLSPWGTPLHVYLAKKGLLPAFASQHQLDGLRWERALAEFYEAETGVHLVRPGQRLDRHPRHDWLACSRDFVSEDGKRAVEMKTADPYSIERAGWGHADTDEVPPGYWLQVQHAWMCCPDVEEYELYVMFSAFDRRRYSFCRDIDVQDLLVAGAYSFWQRVLKDDPPEPDWSHTSTTSLLAAMHRPAKGRLIVFDVPGSPEEAALEEYLAHRDAAGAAEKARELCKARIRAGMGDAEVAVFPGLGLEVVCAERERKGYTVETTNYVDFRIRKVRNP